MLNEQPKTKAKKVENKSLQENADETKYMILEMYDRETGEPIRHFLWEDSTYHNLEQRLHNERTQAMQENRWIRELYSGTFEECLECEGTGYVQIDFMTSETETCPECDGTGILEMDEETYEIYQEILVEQFHYPEDDESGFCLQEPDLDEDGNKMKQEKEDIPESIKDTLKYWAGEWGFSDGLYNKDLDQALAERGLDDAEQEYQDRYTEMFQKGLRKLSETTDFKCPFCGSDFTMPKDDDGIVLCGNCEQRFNPDRNKERSRQTGFSPWGVTTCIHLEFESGEIQEIPVYTGSVEIENGKVFYKRLDNDESRGLRLNNVRNVMINFEKEDKSKFNPFDDEEESE